ncbi:uncharacterized protein METZ01_LOCUS189899, partial [marine metagenome]
MGISKLINVNDVLYEILGTMDAKKSEDKGTEYWKKR